MIRQAIAKWHGVVRAQDPAGIAALLHDDAVFYSPVVYAPQRGKVITGHYLAAAIRVFSRGTFEYVREMIDDSSALLEFTAEIDGIQINGIDLIDFDDDGLITEFKVMVRPAKGLHKLQDLMMAALTESMPRR